MINPVCPHCIVALKPRRSTQLGRYYCPSCFGVVANTGDLARVLSQTELAEFRQQIRTGKDGAAPCTHCRRKMKLVWHHVGQHEVELDACVRCDVIWFDAGESQDFDHRQGREAALASRETTLQYARAILQADENLQRAAKPPMSDERYSLPLGKTLLTFMNLPVEEEKDFFDSEPWVTWLLIALCTLSFVFAYGRFEFVRENFGYFQNTSALSRMIHSITAFFVHAGLFHLLGNMYFLWIFGDNVEDELGKGRYLGLVAAATIAGNILFGALDPLASQTALVGASGGIAGLVAFYLIRFPHRRFMTRFFFFFLIPIPGFVFGALFFLKDLFGAFQEMQGATAVAHLAHLGGALIGAAAAFMIPKKVKAT